jgi:hypothetical protein
MAGLLRLNDPTLTFQHLHVKKTITKPMDPLLKAENRAALMQKVMTNIDILQNEVIEEANNQIIDLAEFENAARQRFEALRENLTDF